MNFRLKYLFFIFLILFAFSSFKNREIVFSGLRGTAIKKLEKFLNSNEREVSFSVNEINSGIKENDLYFPPYIENLKIKLEKNLIMANFVVRKNKLKDGLIVDILRFFLKDVNDVSATIFFVSKNFSGRYEVKEISLNGHKIPGFISSKVVKLLIENSKFPYMDGEEFNLPFGIREISIEKNYIKILR